MKLKTILLSAVLSGAFASANAVIVVPGNVPQIDSNLVRNPCGLSSLTGSGNPVFGCLNDDHAQLVQIGSDESLEITGGQAELTATDGLLSQLSISLVDSAALGTAIFDIDASADGFITFADGSGTDGTYALDGNGSNFFTATGIAGDFLSFTTYDSNMNEADIVVDVKQIRLGIAPIPEPETYALMMAGLAALGFVARRRKLRS